ncbi:hypothetical protein Pcinc_003457 [Petrolisthes cinctipes]|uniref:Uncharacterized protein n=1 Tax=Petrolisthes cinctipes TaxID=88211 RepID=A0AAE1GGL1_PETCI|nr:hypothetical protein Pcinc_003457 [Petrolisthes cinctipes]
MIQPAPALGRRNTRNQVITQEQMPVEEFHHDSSEDDIEGSTYTTPKEPEGPQGLAILIRDSILSEIVPHPIHCGDGVEVLAVRIYLDVVQYIGNLVT